MKIYKTQAEVDADIVDGNLVVNDDVSFLFHVTVPENINARNITAWNINAWNITARNINAWNITAGNINAWNITAGNIDAENIDAGNIDAWNINAENINAGNIKYYAFCCVYNDINCTSIVGRREIHHQPVCLDGKLTIRNAKIKED